MELVNLAIDRPGQKDYEFYIAEPRAGRIGGYVCFGPTPATEGTYDLYWIAVDPEFQRKGVGGRLMARVEEAVRSRKGRMVVIETSSMTAYEPTRRFYENHAYRIESRIKDFYRPGDDRLTYVKRFHPFG